MTSQQWLADYLEQGRPGPESDAPDAASADAARRLRALLAEPDSWAEPPAGLLDEILAGIDSERVGWSGPRRAGTAVAARSISAERSGPVPPHCWRPPRS
jgi:hypothetical protein